MSMNVGTDYSANKAGFTSAHIPQVERVDLEEQRKRSESVKPKLDQNSQLKRVQLRNRSSGLSFIMIEPI